MNKIDGMIKHYAELFNNRKFDEYDVAGFLILIRNDEIKGNHPFIYDFANIVAHRARTEGVACTAMSTAIGNKFELDKKGKVKGFYGPTYINLMKETKMLSEKYSFNAEKDFCREFVLCLMSIAQNVTCKYDNQIICELQLFQTKNNNIALVAMGKDNSVCYSLYESKIDFENRYSWGLIDGAVEAIRIEDKLELRFCENGNRV